MSLEHVPELFDGERLDDMGFDHLRIIQKPETFCYGIDAVLLADFAAEGGKHLKDVCEFGTGNGAVSLILQHKAKVNSVKAVEMQEKMAMLASRNVSLNELTNVEVLHNDILRLPESYRETFDTIVSNPPYMKKEGGLTGASSEKLIARHETTATLEDFLKVGAKLLKDGGSFYMIHRPYRMADMVVLGRKYRLEPKLARLVAPVPGKEPNLLLMKFTKGGKPELRWKDTLYVRGEDGEYSKEINDIYER